MVRPNPSHTEAQLSQLKTFGVLCPLARILHSVIVTHKVQCRLFHCGKNDTQKDVLRRLLDRIYTSDERIVICWVYFKKSSKNFIVTLLVCD